MCFFANDWLQYLQPKASPLENTLSHSELAALGKLFPPISSSGLLSPELHTAIFQMIHYSITHLSLSVHFWPPTVQWWISPTVLSCSIDRQTVVWETKIIANMHSIMKGHMHIVCVNLWRIWCSARFDPPPRPPFFFSFFSLTRFICFIPHSVWLWASLCLSMLSWLAG